MSNRDDLISALLDTANVRIEPVTLDLNGVEWKIGVRQMTKGVHGRLSSLLYKAHKSEDLEAVSKVQLEIVKETAVCMDDGKPLFVKVADAGRLKDQAGTGWLDKVFTAAMKIMQSPNQRFCQIETESAIVAKPAEGDKPAIAARAAKVCGGELTMGAPKCPWCGGDVPNALEVATKNC